MSKTLADRLGVTKKELQKANVEIVRLSGRLPPEVVDSFQVVLALEGDVEHWLGLIHARSAARQMLSELEATADSNDLVPFCNTRIRFQHARFIGVQAYLATNWALADRLTALVGCVLCVKNSSGDPKNQPQLVSHFIGEGTKKSTASMLFSSLRQTFGWPIGISYALRNHFLHDGARIGGTDFFDGPGSKSGFRISEEGWRLLETNAQNHGARSAQHRAGPSWPTSPRDDLRVLIDACERETDDALGILVGSACRSLVAHIGCMLGAD